MLIYIANNLSVSQKYCLMYLRILYSFNLKFFHGSLMILKITEVPVWVDLSDSISTLYYSVYEHMMDDIYPVFIFLPTNILGTN